MIVYADRDEVVDTDSLLNEMDSLSDSVERLIRFGQFESAALDALCPEADDIVDPLSVPLPKRLRLRIAEGFAWYALYPEQYRDAALRFVREKQPHACAVVGIRSIGTTLSRVVADALPCPFWRITVRPRGHPFERELHLSERLQVEIRRRSSEWFLIVDEGPGLSGSSFTAVAEKLSTLGVPDERIVLFPAHEPDVSAFRSERARERWPKHPCYVEPFHAERFVPAGARDLSGGLWREVLVSEVAVQPQHERRKYLHDGVLWKFCGLGAYGRAKIKRARELNEFIPPAEGLENGFLLSRWIDGTPARSVDDSLLDSMAGYLAKLSELYTTSELADPASLIEMIRVNVGHEVAPPDPAAALVRVDGRMLPQEWLKTERGWLKADALDHHDDHFFPGCQDIAWDIAGAAVEFDFQPDMLAQRYTRLRPDPTLSRRLGFYTVAYLAYRIGYATMAAETLGDCVDGRRFQLLRRRYEEQLLLHTARDK
jgi:hypothetical protein